MDLFEELERMAQNATSDPDSEASLDEIARWQRLFNYSHAQATSLIVEQKSDYTRYRISHDHWELIRPQLEDQGYDCNAYEHELDRYSKRAGLGLKIAAPPKLSAAQACATYILKLDGPLSTSEEVKVAAGIADLPQCISSNGNEANATFCTVNGAVKGAIIHYLAVNRIKFTPMFVRVTGSAKKNLSADSIFPTLGVDSTFPQNRAASKDIVFEPAQDQYPVMYFFYGTLADKDVLTRHLGLSEEEMPVLRSAEVRGGRLECWAGKYKALVDAPGGKVVSGYAYEVTTREREDALRAYETDNYEVVRCCISVDGRMVKGCTFRFINPTHNHQRGDFSMHPVPQDTAPTSPSFLSQAPA